MLENWHGPIYKEIPMSTIDYTNYIDAFYIENSWISQRLQIFIDRDPRKKFSFRQNNKDLEYFTDLIQNNPTKRLIGDAIIDGRFRENRRLQIIADNNLVALFDTSWEPNTLPIMSEPKCKTFQLNSTCRECLADPCPYDDLPF